MPDRNGDLRALRAPDLVELAAVDPNLLIELRYATSDDFTERAHPDYAGGTAEERRNRDLLRAAMEAEGFTVYENEWWHFDYQGWEQWPVMDVGFESVSKSKSTRR